MLHWICRGSLCSYVAVVCLHFLGLTHHVGSLCTPPISGSWYRPYDSATITFTGPQLRGHVTPIGSQSPDDYACWRSTGSKYVFQLESTVDGPLGKTRGYFCWQLVPLTSNTALLYQLTSIHRGPYFTNERVVEGNVGDKDPSISEVCSLDSTVEYPSILYKGLTHHVGSLCTPPISGSWYRPYDSATITFTGPQLRGHVTPIGSQSPDDYACWRSTGSKYVFQVENTVDGPLGPTRGYFCWQLVPLTSTTALLYQLTSIHTGAYFPGQRVHNVNMGQQDPSISEVCSLDSTVEYPSILYKGLTHHVGSLCTPPISGSWYRPYDSATITFTGPQLRGHVTPIGSQSPDDYACWRSTGSKYVFQVENTVDGPLGPTRGYFCWQLVPLTSTTALLYQLTSIHTGAYFPGQRVHNVNMGQQDPSISEVCSLDSTVEYPSILYKGLTHHVGSLCTPPISGSWYRPYDSATITFTGPQLRGHVTPIGSQSPDDYACWRSTGSKYVFQVENTVDGPLGPTRGYFCWQLVPLTSTTALLYQLTSIHTGAYFPGQRVHNVNMGQQDPSISEVCSLDSTVEYPSILYKVSNPNATDVDVATAPSARQNCPADVLATYSYEKDQPCPDGVSQLNFCLDGQTARVDANCSDEILFSNDGVLSCLAHFTRGDKLFMILLNEDSTLTGTATRFACLMIQGAGSAVAYANDCTSSTNTDTHALTMNRKASCRLTHHVGSLCTPPISGSWYRPYDSATITFTGPQLRGHVTPIGSQSPDDYACWRSTGSKYVFQVENTVDGPLGPTRGYFCWQLVPLTSTTALLYQLTSIHTGAYFPGQRVHNVNMGQQDPSISDVCSVDSTVEYPSILYKVSSPNATDVDVTTAPSARQNCPADVLATYSYEKDQPCPDGVSQLNFCLDGQTARVDANCSDEILFSTSCRLTHHVGSLCTPPISGSWYRPYDSATITFTGPQLRGHVTPIGSQSPDDYACWRSTGSKYVFQVENTVDGPLGPTRGYFCWQLVPLTSTTALLYQLTSIHTGAYFPGQRVHNVNMGQQDPSISEVCSLDSTVEYPSILYKVSSPNATDVDVTTAPSARQNCPADVLATYSYEKDQPCPDGVSQLNFCLDGQTARVDANCSDEILFSNDGVLSCLANFTRGDKLFMILLNEDSTLTGTATRFACLLAV
ncbi:uncharacterized protein, partial [Littorina saxatilis]|uniref:uncharacterized protein n=1 Tax=Littorina saxatilis TaxID=31220 RepID=UPI0038B603F8